MIKNILLFCFVCGALLVGCELTLRVIGIAQAASHAPVKIGEFHPTLGWKLNPRLTRGSHSYRSEDGRHIDFYVNADGYRGGEFESAADPAVKRILVLGDSFAQADQILLEERFSERLQALLNARAADKKFDVRNLGVSGYSTDQEYLTYLEEGKKFDPDLTLLLFHDNDVWMNTEDVFIDVQKPRLEYRNDELVLAHHPDPNWAPSAGPGASAPSARPNPLVAAKEYLSGHSKLYAWIRKKVRESSVLVGWAARAGLTGVQLAEIPADFKVWAVRPDQRTEEAWVLTEAILKKLQERIEDDGGRLVIVYVPPRPAVYPEHWLATRIRYGFNDTDWDIREVAKRLEAICARLRLPLIDPSEDLIRAAREPGGGKRMYFAMDSHWTREAHAVVADVILREAADELD